MHQAAETYRSVASQSQTPREQEAYLLLKSAKFLQDILDEWDERQGELSEALDYYRKLWVMLSTSATSEDNPLPLEVKQNVANLAVYCITRAMDAEWSKDQGRLRQLIFINKQIAAGLRGSSSEASDEKSNT